MYENRAFRGMKPTTKFWMLMVQNGEGCDYTIGCGLCAEPLKAQTIEEARKEAEDFFTARDEDGWENSHHVNPKSESALEHVVLVTASEFLPLEKWQEEYLAYRAKKDAEEQRKKDEAELERLQKKLGK
jgi:hypothetical protein